MFTLYYAPHTCSLASHIALEDAGAVYELKRVDFDTMEQKSLNYVAINPKARVPTMITPLRRQNPREEPGALAAHAGICTGGGWQRPSLPCPLGRSVCGRLLAFLPASPSQSARF